MLKTLAKLVLKMFFKLEVRLLWEGKPPERLIVMANHQSFLDPFLVGCFLPFEMTWLVHSTIAAKWHFRQFLRLFPHVVVDAANPLAMKSIVHLIEAGKRVCIFPEGRITVTGSLMKVYDGLAFLQAKTGAELLPVIIDGAVHSRVGRMKPPYPILPRPKVRVTIYAPVRLPQPDGQTGRQRRRAASDQIRQLLEERWFRAQPPSTIFESFLRAAELFGREAELIETQSQEPQPTEPPKRRFRKTRK